jgi:phage repressor protein C with HTH and peptisase S24 domain
MDAARKALDELIQSRRGCTYSNISRLLGRNVSYIQQYIRKGSPRHLDEGDRIVLARFFGVEESVLGNPPRRTAPVHQLIQVPVLDVEASAGYGALAEMESKSSQFGFEEAWLRKLTPNKSTNLSIIRVLGDSMEPTLHDGDEVMVDLADGMSWLRNGIYVLRVEDTLSIKRIELEPQGKRIAIVSDNPEYQSRYGLQRGTVGIVGRVLWFGRKLQ